MRNIRLLWYIRPIDQESTRYWGTLQPGTDPVWTINHRVAVRFDTRDNAVEYATATGLAPDVYRITQETA